VNARIDSPGPPTSVTVEITPASTVTATAEQGRVLLRIDADALDPALPAAGGGLVDQIRTADQANTIAVVLNANAGPPRITQSTADGVARVNIEVGAASAPTPAAPATAAPAAPAPVPGATLGSPRPAFQTVVIDPGHGGDDIGTKGAGGLQEKAFTLDVARRLRALIEMRLGLRVFLTRDDDRPVALDARAAVANNSKADLFISLHANASSSPALAGAEIYHLKLDREGEDARRQAEAEAVALPVLGGGTRSLDVIRWDLAQARHVNESAMLASLVAEELRKTVPLSPRGIQQAPLRVLEGADTPAVLVEMLYVSNAAQEKAAGTDEFKNAIAQGLFDAIVRFRAYAEEQRPR
jgi:N-acetylmuramoyl-L-alanine amidase